MRMAGLLFGALFASCGCGGGSQDNEGNGSPIGVDGGVSPAPADKAKAIGTVKHVKTLDLLLATGDPDDILNQIAQLLGTASLIVLASPPAPAAPLASPSNEGPLAAPGSGSCDASGCVFTRYPYTLPSGAGYVADGTIVIGSVDASTRTLTLDLTLEGYIGPTHVTAGWTLTASVLDGPLQWVREGPSLDESLVRFDGVILSGGEPTGGSLYAKWVTTQFGGYDTTVLFP
jgi:hypothetical protein